MGKLTDKFGRLKFWLPQNLPFKGKTYPAGRTSNKELVIDASFKLLKWIIG